MREVKAKSELPKDNPRRPRLRRSRAAMSRPTVVAMQAVTRFLVASLLGMTRVF